MLYGIIVVAVLSVAAALYATFMLMGIGGRRCPRCGKRGSGPYGTKFRCEMCGVFFEAPPK